MAERQQAFSEGDHAVFRPLNYAMWPQICLNRTQEKTPVEFKLSIVFKLASLMLQPLFRSGMQSSECRNIILTESTSPPWRAHYDEHPR